MTDLIGQSLGRYHILEQLGEGGMATVYKAYDTRLERDVAVKVIRTDQFGSAVLGRILKRFEREGKALARLTHPNIVGVIDYGEQDGIPYLVMPYLPGQTLKQYLGKPMPWQEAVRLLLPIAQALQYAHEQGIVHRDIKPSNILLTQTNQPMLSDFGIAKMLENDQTATLSGTGMGVGTPEYMAPEQWTGEAGAQADIYSLGVVLYELVTGRKPYVADTPAAVLLKQASEPLPRPRQYVQDLPERAEQIIFKALARKPEDRYLSMGAFVVALEEQPSGNQKHTKAEKRGRDLPKQQPAAISPSPIDQGHKTQRSSEKRWIPITLLVILFGILLALGVWVLGNYQPGKVVTANVAISWYVGAAGFFGILPLLLAVILFFTFRGSKQKRWIPVAILVVIVGIDLAVGIILMQGQGIGAQQTTETQIPFVIVTPYMDQNDFVKLSDVAEPAGTHTWTASVSSKTKVQFSWSWCTATPEILDQNLKDMLIYFFMDGIDVTSSMGKWSTTIEGGVCRTYNGVIYWIPGESEGQHTILYRMIFLKKVNDGQQDYEGEISRTYYITVTP
jgi:serine/threonine protein kinase